MIKPKKSVRDIWNHLGMQKGQIIDRGSVTQRSISEYKIGQQLKEQHLSFVKNKQNRQFLEDELTDSEIGSSATVKKQTLEEQKYEWQHLALELSQMKQNTNDQTFSPITRLRSKQKTDDKENYKSIEKEQQVCKLQGHENNQIKFICTNSECPYKFHKACAHCVIKLHARHVEQMVEIESFEMSLLNNIKKAEEIVRQGALLIKKIQYPYEDFFNQLKEALVSVIDDIERRFVNRNRENVQKLIKVELEQIQQFNQKFEEIQSNKSQQNLNLLLNDESIRQYEHIICQANEKMRPTFNIEEIKTLVETNVTTLLLNTRQSQFSTPLQSSRALITPREQSPNLNKTTTFQTNSASKMLSPRSPLNVFNYNITSRQQLLKYRSNY